MKTNLFRKVGLLGLSTLAAFTFMSNVKAEEQCTTYTNYYFFSDINAWEEDTSKWNTNPTIYSFQWYVKENNGTWVREGESYNTWFAPLYDANKRKNPKEIKVDKVCLKKGNTTDTNSNVPCIDDGGKWNLSYFYTEYKKLDASNNKIDFNNPKSGADYNRILDINNTTRYYDHGRLGSETASNNKYTPLSGTDVNELVAASFFPTKTQITFDFATKSDLIGIQPVRRIQASDYSSGVTPMIIDIYDGDENPKAALAPALYKVTFKADCETVTPTPTPTTYTAKIHYCIEKDDNTCIPATDVDKNAKDYSKEGLADGTKVSKESYTIKNCKLKKNDDKIVEHTINKKNFEYTVRYVCDEEAAPVNPKTGIALIIAAWVVGLGALGYSAYYFMNARKEENAEL